jgi:hypothetical protein
MEKYGFVYIWRDKKYPRFYIGSHWGTEGDGYVCSSRWMRNTYKRRPEDFKRRILARGITSKQDLLVEEGKWLALIPKEEIGKKYYNLHNSQPGHWSATDNKLSIQEKIKKAVAGFEYYTDGKVNRKFRESDEIPFGFVRGFSGGHPQPESMKEKLRKPRSEEFKEKHRHPLGYDRKKPSSFSEEHLKRLRESMKGFKPNMSGLQSEEAKNKRRLSLKGKPKSEAHRNNMSHPRGPYKKTLYASGYEVADALGASL